MPIAATVTLGERVLIPHPELVNLYGCDIGNDASIGPFVEIQGDVRVGARCKISSHSFISAGVSASVPRSAAGRFRPDVDVLRDLAVYDVAILDYLFESMPVAVTATGATFVERDGPRSSELAFMTLRYANGLFAHLHVNWFSPIKIRRTMVGARRRMVVYDDLEQSEKLKVYDRGVDPDPAEPLLAEHSASTATLVEPTTAANRPHNANVASAISPVRRRARTARAGNA